MRESAARKGRSREALGEEKLREIVIPAKMWVIPEEVFISMAVDIDCWVTESARQSRN